MDWNAVVLTLIVQIASFGASIYAANKNSIAGKSQIDSSTVNSMLRIDLKRLCTAIEDDVPYEKLKEMVESIENEL